MNETDITVYREGGSRIDGPWIWMHQPMHLLEPGQIVEEWSRWVLSTDRSTGGVFTVEVNIERPGNEASVTLPAYWWLP